MLDPSLPPEETRRAALQALWTFPSVVASAFVVAWGAEAAQFYVSQGLALALLAWIQVLPEFAVEAVIAWERDIPLMTANFTGALRLLTGLGWPTIYVVYAFTRRLRGDRSLLPRIELDEEHAAEVIGLVAPLLYFVWVIAKASLNLVDAAVLLLLYAGYLALVQRLPPRESEEVEDAPPLVRRIVALPVGARVTAITSLFVGGGLLLFFAARPFLFSMVGLATLLGVSQFVFVQWVAPFLSELPEFLSTTNWARQHGKAGLALMNMASSNVNQWTVLAAMIPVVYSMSIGHPATVPLAEHRLELTLTWLQGMLGIVILANLTFEAYEAAGLFALWFAQFLVPHWREEVCVLYAVWLALELVSTTWRPGRLRAFGAFVALWRHPPTPRRRA
jgi:cation:H+ antiporter